MRQWLQNNKSVYGMIMMEMETVVGAVGACSLLWSVKRVQIRAD